jgi:hypothetical protein
MFLNYNVQDSNRAIGIVRELDRRHTHRLSSLRKIERQEAVCVKIIEMMAMSGGFVTEDLAREWTRAHHGVVFRRGRIRVHGIEAVVEPMLRYFPEFAKDFTGDFLLFWEFNVRLRTVSRYMRIVRQVLGSSIFDTGRIRPTWRFYRMLFCRLLFNKDPSEVRPNKLKVLKNLELMNPQKGLFNMFWRKLPSGLLFKQFVRELMSIKTMVFGGLFQSSLQPKSDLKALISKFPFLSFTIYGEKRLTRRQLNSLRNRKQLMMKVMLWDLLFNVPVIRKELNLAQWSRFTIELSLLGFTAFNNFATVKSEDGKVSRVEFSRPSVVTTGDGIPVHRNNFLNPGRMVVPMMNVGMFAGVLKRKVRKVRNSIVTYPGGLF